MNGGGGQDLELPPGFRFHPTDDELVNHYLCRKCASQALPASVIAETDLYKFDPWDLPELSRYGEKEWYFFSPRDRKYPNGSRPNRTAGTGYWKATGADKPIGQPKILGIKKALVFYAGKAPNGIKTNWIMHEYRLANVDRSAASKKNLRLDDWVLCRIYNKKGTIEKPFVADKKKVTTDNAQRVPDRQSWSVMMQRTGTDSGCSEYGVSSEEEIVNSRSEAEWSNLDLDLDFLSRCNDFPDDTALTPIYQTDEEQNIFINWQTPFY